MGLQSSNYKQKQGKNKAKSFMKMLISLLVIVLCIYYAVKDIDFAKLWDIMLNANYIWVVISVPVIISSHWMRAMRWRRILKPIKEVKSVYPLFSSVMIGYALNAITPRGGEFVRPYSFSRREKVSYSSAFATIVVERFIDLITLFLLLAGTFIFLSHKITQALPDNFDTNRIILYGGLILFIILLAFYPPVVRFILKIFIKPFSEKIYEKLSGLFDKFTVGLSIIKSPSEYFMLTVESVMIWLLYALPMFFMFFSFNFQQTANLGFDDAVLLLVVSGVVTTLAPTPGALGVYHVAIQNAMVSLYNIPSEEALAYATLTHAINYLVQLALGGLYFLKENSLKNSKLYYNSNIENNEINK